MANTLNFNKVAKKYLTVTLADEDQTTLMIGTPTKGVMNEMIMIQNGIKELNEGADEEKMDSLYELCARLMSRNKGGIEITKQTIESLFDLEDIIIFFNAYSNFIDEVIKGKN